MQQASTRESGEDGGEYGGGRGQRGSVALILHPRVESHSSSWGRPSAAPVPQGEAEELGRMLPPHDLP